MRFGHYADFAHYEESCSLVEKVWRARVARKPKARKAEQVLAVWHARNKVANVAKRRINHARRRQAMAGTTPPAPLSA